MGFMDFISNIGSKIRQGVSTIGNFIGEKVRPVIGTISGVARKISDVINSAPGQAIIGGLSNVPGIGGLIARGAGIVGKVAGTVAGIGENIGKGLDIAQGVAQNVSSDNPNFGQAIQDVKKGYGLVQDSRNLYNQSRTGAAPPPPMRPAVYQGYNRTR